MDDKCDLLADGVGSINEVVSYAIPDDGEEWGIAAESTAIAAQCTDLLTKAGGDVVLRSLAVAILNRDFIKSHRLYSIVKGGEVVAETITTDAARVRIARDIGI